MATVTAPTKMELCQAIMLDNPDLTVQEVAEHVDCDPGTALRAKQKMKTSPVKVKLSDIDFDFDATQMRPDLDRGRVTYFQGLYEEGRDVDPIEVYETPKGTYVTDGWTRCEGAALADFEEIDAYVIVGTVEEAIRAAARANSKAALPRCEDTKRNAVFAICRLDGHEKGVLYYAEATGVHYVTAKKYMDQFIAENQLSRPDKTPGKDGKLYPIKKKSSSPVPRDEPEPDERRKEPVATNGSGSFTPYKTESAPAKNAPAGPEADLRWIKEECCRSGAKPVRDQLTEANRVKYDQDVLAYRELHENDEWPRFVQKANKLTGDKVVGGQRGGPYLRRVSWYARSRHPRDWPRCGNCKGVGCESCKGFGYII